jgi:hypothetical protein
MNKQLIAVLATGVIVCGAMGQATTQPTKQPAGTPPAPKSPLAGPKVPDRTGKPTIVERGMDGKVTKIDEWPALAAVRKLKLDEKTKAAVAKLELEQAAAMDKMLSENLLEVAAVANFFQSGDAKEGLAGIKKLKEGNPVLEERSLLAQRISKLLPKEQGEELGQMVQEYWNALIQEADEAAKTRGEKSGAAKVAGAEALRLLGQDIKASYERVIGQQVKDFDALIKTLGLSGEQESRVRKIVDDAFAKAKGNTAKMSKSDVFWKVWKELNAEQRSVLVEQFKGKGK